MKFILLIAFLFFVAYALGDCTCSVSNCKGTCSIIENSEPNCVADRNCVASQKKKWSPRQKKRI